MRRFRVIELGRLFGRASALVALAGLCLPAGAGERLIIGGAKTRIQPGSEDDSSTKIKSVRTLSTPSPFNGAVPLSASRRKTRNLKLEKKIQNERDERENWALLAPGELQQTESEEYNFGVREYNLDDLEKKEATRDYTFYGLDKAKNQEPDGRTQSSDPPLNVGMGQPRNRLSGQTSQNAVPRDREEVNRNPTSSPNPFRASRPADNAPALGAHVATELDLNAMLEPTENMGGLHQILGDSDPTLRSLLGSSIPPNQADEHQQRMDSFRRMLSGGLTKPEAIPDLLNYPSDKTRQSLNPVVSSPAPSASSGFSKQQLLQMPKDSMAVKPPALPENPSQFSPARSSVLSDSAQPLAVQPERAQSQSFSPLQDMPRRKF